MLRCVRRRLAPATPAPDQIVDDTVSRELASKIRSTFYDVGQKKCTLCDEHYTCSSFMGHTAYAWHQARVGILERLMSLSPSAAVQAPKTWWSRISKNPSCDFRRIPSLSAETQPKRFRRLFYLLAFFVQRGVIRESLTIYQNGNISRSREFEKFEMVGDNVIKFGFADRLTLLFPAEEGGLPSRLQLIQQLIDSNEGLLKCYDYLHLDWIIGCKLPNSKMKSDVVESLFGELQTWLWADDVKWGRETYDLLQCAEHRTLRAVVEHTLNELIHVLVMFALISTHSRGIEFVLKNSRTQKVTKRLKGFAESSQEVIQRAKKYEVRPYLEELRFASSAAGGSHQLVPKGPLLLQPVPGTGSALLKTKTSVTPRIVGSRAEYLHALQHSLHETRKVPTRELRRNVVEQAVSKLYLTSVGWGQIIKHHADSLLTTDDPLVAVTSSCDVLGSTPGAKAAHCGDGGGGVIEAAAYALSRTAADV